VLISRVKRVDNL